MDKSTWSKRWPGSAGNTHVTEHELIEFVAALPEVTAITASADIGAPEIAWGDTFFYYDPDGTGMSGGRMPFATIVTKDYPGVDTTSEVDREGVYRLNVAAGREHFRKVVGYSPAAHADRSGEHDYTACDRILPHPVYAAQGWVCVLNPGAATSALTRTLLVDVHARARRQHRRS